ncbi:Fatty acyl-coenzyme A reductase [Theobroma cacao]|nr:Fatty acyl-coenzyme A reductase [Theobroma cacao]
MNMELDNVVKFLQGKTILVTGATGFLAKVFVEKILRLQPNVNKLYLLLRAADTNSATKRLNGEIISTELFRILRDGWGSEFDLFLSTKVIAVPGDISSENLGLNESKLREHMLREIEIVVHVAATTGFNERQVYMDLNRKIKFAMRLAEFYKPYAFFKGIFSDKNLDKLRMVAQERGIDMGVFDFDSKSIDWEDYMINIHIPGLLRHAVKS